MKLSTGIVTTVTTVFAALLACTGTAYAQAQTFHFGEGQSGMQPAQSPSGDPAPSKTLSKRKAQHRKPAHRAAPQPDTYSHS